MVSIINTQEIADKIGLNPLRSGLGFNIKELIEAEHELSKIVSIPSDRVLVSINVSVAEDYTLVGLNPLRSGLGFNPMTGKSSAGEKLAVSIPSDRVLVSIADTIAGDQEDGYSGLNPLRSGLGFNIRPHPKRLYCRVSIPSDRVLVSIIINANKKLKIKGSQSPQIGSWFQYIRGVNLKERANGLSQSPQIGSWFQ